MVLNVGFGGAPGGSAGWIVKAGVMARGRAGAEEIVSHDVDPIQVTMDFVHLGVLKIVGSARGRDGEDVASSAGAFALVAEDVELGAQLARSEEHTSELQSP